MNLFLEQKYNYIFLAPLDHVRSQIKSILKTPWYDLTINLGGRISKDNTLKIYPKSSFFSLEILGILRSPAIITGRLEANEQQTNIKLLFRPNYAYLFIFYLLIFLFSFKLVDLFTSHSESRWIEVIILFFSAIFFRSLIHFSIGRLKNRFERTMSIHPEE